MHIVNARGELRISIHAPAKGATIPFISFNHLLVNFNPRSREGSDSERNNGGTCVHISIHAPAKGATSLYSSTSGHLKISIHAPAKGATMACKECGCLIKISIHAPAKGATAAPAWILAVQCRFQSTLPRRERRREDRSLAARS